MTPLTVGVDVGGTHVRAGAVVDGQTVDVVRRPHDVPGGTAAPTYVSLLDGVVGVVDELSARHDVAAIGVAMAGTLSADRSTIVSNAHADWEGRTLPADLAARTGLPTSMENDGNCATWAEHVSGAGRGADPFVMLTLGTGVGGGVVANGALVLGGHGIAGELGHICVVEPGGLACVCGAYGCLEQYASGRSMINRFSAGSAGPWSGTAGWQFAGMPEELRAAESLMASQLSQGNVWAATVVDDAGRALAAGIAALVRVLDVGTIAIGGGAASLGVPLLGAIRRAVTEYPGASSRRLDVAVLPAEHGEYAGLVGAALLAAQPPVASNPPRPVSPVEAALL